MPPSPFIATTTAGTTTAAAELQKLASTYGPQANALSQSATMLYFSNLTLLQTISVLLSACFIAATVYVLIRTGWLAIRIDRVRDVILKTNMSKKRVHDTWESIERHFFAGDDNDLKVAIIEADTLLDEALRDAGVPGAQLGDRLKKISTSNLPNIEEVWQAHKIRNRIAHEADFVLKRDLAERALTVYEKALEHLGVLEPMAPSSTTTNR